MPSIKQKDWLPSLYPDYQLTEEERQSMKGPQVKALKKERHRKITEFEES